MSFAKVLNGKITVPIEIRRKLGIKEGDKIIFLERANGEIVLQKLILSRNKGCQRELDVDI